MSSSDISVALDSPRHYARTWWREGEAPALLTQLKGRGGWVVTRLYRDGVKVWWRARRLP